MFVITYLIALISIKETINHVIGFWIHTHREGMTFLGQDYFLLLSMHMQEVRPVPVISVELKNNVCCLIPYFCVLTQPMLPETCQHGDIQKSQLPLFSKKLWGFLVVDKSLERWMQSPTQIYNLWFNQSRDFGIPRFSKSISQPMSLPPFSQDRERHRLKFYFLCESCEGKGGLLILLPWHT